MSAIRLATFNLWHGLSPTAWWGFEALEPSGRRELREQIQLEIFAHQPIDLWFLQEVNPVVGRVDRICQKTHLEGILQADMVGTKLLGLGFPYNLNSGLATLARPELALRPRGHVKLSGAQTSLVWPWLSVQLQEERFALLGEFLQPGWGRVLAVNLHLHHGLEWTPEFQAQVLKIGQDHKMSTNALAEIKERGERGNQRRHREISDLLNLLESLKERYEVILMGGDFNCSPESAVYQMLKEAGFVDFWTLAPNAGAGLSFDPQGNAASHHFQKNFSLPLQVEDLTFDEKTREALVRLIRAHENRPRRIDYVWGWARSKHWRVTRTELLGHPDANGLAPSDHFGVAIHAHLG